MPLPPGISDGAAEAYANWYGDNFLQISYADWTLYSGVVSSSLTPISTAPSEDFTLYYLATSAGTVVVTGTKDGVAVVETISLSANSPRLGSKSFDATPSSITCSCPTGTIKVACVSLSGKTIQKETSATVACKWEDYTKKWQDGTVTDARVLCQSSTVKVGDVIRFDRDDRDTPVNGDNYEVKALRDRRNPESRALLFVVLYVK